MTGRRIDLDAERTTVEAEIRAKEREALFAWVEGWPWSRLARWELHAYPILRDRRRRLRDLERLERLREERALCRRHEDHQQESA
jgi:hypothetical protein